VIAALTLTALAVFAAPERTGDPEWTDYATVTRRGAPVVEYRAAVAGGSLIVEARHAPDWHTYAMDNPERARAKTGIEHPECELPTRIELTGTLEAAGAWKQTQPMDLSTPEIHWYTWGFEDTAYFVVPVRRTEDAATATVTIHAQACNASQCSMIDALTIDLQPGEATDGEIPPAIRERLVPVAQP